jgi:hypothetical protein
MSEALNVYWHDDGHYLLVRGPVDAMRDAKLAWLGTMDSGQLPPAVRAGVEEQLQAHTCALITAAQFYAPSLRPSQAQAH